MMSLFIYNCFIRLYDISAFIAQLFNRKAKLWVKGRKNIDKEINKLLALNDKRIWIHCASLGEFEQARPVIEKIKSLYPHYSLILTFFSPSGYEMRKDYKHADYIGYLPADTKKNAERYIKSINPTIAVFVKYEFWYHYISTLSNNNIPILLISAVFRQKQIFFKWYGKLFRELLKKYSKIFVQDKVSYDLLKSISINNTIIAGDTRIDRVYQICQEPPSDKHVEEFKQNHKILIAGSTYAKEESIITGFLWA